MLELQATLIAFIEVKSQLAQRSGCKRLFSAKTQAPAIWREKLSR